MKKITTAEKARQLTGPRTGQELQELRSALLIAWYYPKNGERVRVYWPKSVWPTLEAAQEALKAAGLPQGMDFTQYRAAGPFLNLQELVNITENVQQSIQEELAERKAAPAAVKKAPAKKAPAKKAAEKAPARGSWAQRNPEAVATIPAAIQAGQHPRQFAEAHGISLEISWRLFKTAGWVATGKGGGGKPFTFKSKLARNQAAAAVNALQRLADEQGVSVQRVMREVAATA